MLTRRTGHRPCGSRQGLYARRPRFVTDGSLPAAGNSGASVPLKLHRRANHSHCSRVVLREGRLVEECSSFASAVDPLIPRALRVARAFLGPLSDPAALAQDAVQEALIRAYRAWPGLPDKERDIWPWFYTIVVRECHRLLRHPRNILPLPDSELVDPRPSPLESLVELEERTEAAKALAGLAYVYRSTAELRYIHGLSCADTAAVLGVQVGTVKWRLHEARVRMRETLVPGDDTGRLRPEPTEPAELLLPPIRWTRGQPASGLVRVGRSWPPSTLDIPGGDRVYFAVASRVRGCSSAVWVGTDRGHNLWWSDGRAVWRSSGGNIAEVRATAEEAAAGAW